MLYSGTAHFVLLRWLLLLLKCLLTSNLTPKARLAYPVIVVVVHRALVMEQGGAVLGVLGSPCMDSALIALLLNFFLRKRD